MPIHPQASAPAIRILLCAAKSSRAPLALYPGLELNDEHGRPTRAAEAVLRDGEVLALAKI
jgi:tRNA1(Val) A37 N6-methylase TrmN6